MGESVTDTPVTKKALILRDTLAFLSLIAITVVLSAITLLLFKSFMAHRVDLAKRWADRGRVALLENEPQQAVAAYRAALSYAPTERQYQLRLAQALGDAGHTEEAYNYFMELWETHPGDGSLNLQLAHLAARKGDTQEAINFYRASLYGTWEGDGIERRRAVRLELAQYLIAQHQPDAARAELLIAGGNTPDTPEIDLTLGRLLEQARAPLDALSFYRKALAIDPSNASALGRAGYLLYTMGDYPAAHRLLQQASHEAHDPDIDPALLANSERILELSPALARSTPERVARILTLRNIAQTRLSSCMAALADKPTLSNSLTSLSARWTGIEGTATRTMLLRDIDKQNASLQLAYDTELATSQTGCSPATGDDALLLLLARSTTLEEVSHR